MFKINSHMYMTTVMVKWRGLWTFSFEKCCQLHQSTKVNHTYMSCKECEADIYPKETLLRKHSDKLPAPQTEPTPPGTASASRISLATLKKKRDGCRGDKMRFNKYIWLLYDNNRKKHPQQIIWRDKDLLIAAGNRTLKKSGFDIKFNNLEVKSCGSFHCAVYSKVKSSWQINVQCSWQFWLGNEHYDKINGKAYMLTYGLTSC